MNTKKDKIKTFHFPVFGYNIKVVSSRNIVDAVKKFKDTECVEIDESTGAITVHIDKEALSYIFIPHDISLLYMVHESYHAIRRMLEYCDVQLENEVVAYHIGYLVQEISNWRWSWK